MRRMITGFSLLALLSVFTVNAFSQSVTGSTIEKTLIDFDVFEERMSEVVTKDKELHQQALEENAELNLTAYGYYDVEIEPADWALSNWQVELCSSADTVNNNIYSYCKSVLNNEDEDDPTTVLGVRVHFPEWKFLSWALVKPPFEIFAQYDNGAYINDAIPDDDENDYNDDTLPVGLLVNVGLIESIALEAYGLNYTHQLGLRLKNRDEEMQEYYMGSLYFHRWRTLVWMNPDYASDPRDRDPEKLPLYPQAYPFVKFDSLVIYKPTTDDGGNFVTYFKDVKINFERAVLEEEEYIDHEDVWNILSDEQMERRITELKEISEEVYLREQVLKRMKASDE